MADMETNESFLGAIKRGDLSDARDLLKGGWFTTGADVNYCNKVSMPYITCLVGCHIASFLSLSPSLSLSLSLSLSPPSPSC
jgi:hypothetical protein